MLHNPAEKHEKDAAGKEKDEDDNDLARFNRWFNFAEPRCYPTGDMPRPDILITESKKAANAAKNAQQQKNKYLKCISRWPYSCANKLEWYRAYKLYCY